MTKKNQTTSNYEKCNPDNVIPTKENVDYDRVYSYSVDPNFSFFKANRKVNKGHVRVIENAIIGGDHKAEYILPIRVDINTYKIIDGQHRYEAFKKAWGNGSKERMRVMYENLPIDEKEKMRTIVDINSTNRNWTTQEYENRLREEGNKYIAKIDEFGKTHTLCQKVNAKGEISYHSRYTHAMIFGRNITKDIKKGSIKVTDKDIEFADRIHSEIEKLMCALGKERNSWFEGFIFAWYNIRKNDGLYNNIIDELGMYNICENIKNYSIEWQFETKTSTWENNFRNAIWQIKSEMF